MEVEHGVEVGETVGASGVRAVQPHDMASAMETDDEPGEPEGDAEDGAEGGADCGAGGAGGDGGGAEAHGTQQDGDATGAEGSGAEGGALSGGPMETEGEQGADAGALQSAEVGHDAATPQQQVGRHTVHSTPCMPHTLRTTPCTPRLARHALRATPCVIHPARHDHCSAHASSPSCCVCPVRRWRPSLAWRAERLPAPTARVALLLRPMPTARRSARVAARTETQ